MHKCNAMSVPHYDAECYIAMKWISQIISFNGSSVRQINSWL